MSENKRSHRHHGDQDPSGGNAGQGPYWTRAHRDWKFWVALSLMFAAMVIFVMSKNLMFRSHYQVQPLSSNAGK